MKMQISARLLPGVQIGDGWLSLQPKGQYLTGEFFIDFPGGKYSDKIGNFRGHCWGLVQDILTFLDAALEGRERTGRESENEDLFPSTVLDWAQQHRAEIQGILCLTVCPDCGCIAEEMATDDTRSNGGAVHVCDNCGWEK